MNSFWQDISAKQLHEDPAIQVYQTNFLAARLKALEYNYPITFNVLGRSRFQAIARHYVHAIPSVNDSLNLYGEHFSAFLSEIIPHNPALSKYTFVSELARLDWFLILAYFAPDDEFQPSLEESQINDTSYLSISASLGLCKITQSPLLKSQCFNLLTKDDHIDSESFRDLLLSEFNQAQSMVSDTTFLPKESPAFIAFIRQELTVRIYLLSQFEYTLLNLIRERTPIFQLDDSIDPSLSLKAISKFKQQGFITGLMNKANDPL